MKNLKIELPELDTDIAEELPEASIHVENYIPLSQVVVDIN